MATLTKRKTTPVSAAPPRTPSFSRDTYLKMIRAALPIPPETEADNERLIQLMLEIDDRAERDGLSPEEKVFSELLAIVVQDFEEKTYPLPSLPPHELLQEVRNSRRQTQGLTRDRQTDFGRTSRPAGSPAVETPQGGREIVRRDKGITATVHLAIL